MSLRSQVRRSLARLGRYGKRVAIAVDQLANALAGGNPDATLSSRAQLARERWRANTDTPADRRAYLWGCVLCGILDGFWAKHCLQSVERDETK